MIQKRTTSSGGAMEYESEVPGFTGEQLEEYILSGRLSPIITESDGVDALAEIYELNGRLILTWYAQEGEESGFEVLETQSLDEAREIAQGRASEITGEYEDVDRFLNLGTLAGSSSRPDRFYPLPDRYSRLGTYELTYDYDRGTRAEIHLFQRESEASDVGPPILVYSSEIGLVVGEFDSLAEVQEEIIEEPLGFTLESTGLDSERR